jgi:uncharacterized membrane protein YbaN (DUF454 family)
MLRQTQLFLWRTIAIVALTLGLIGIALPIMPTVPFLLVAAWAGSKAWPSLENWLLNHRLYGGHIRNWRAHGAVPRYAKVCAILMMMVSATGLQFTVAPLWLKVAVPSTMLVIAVWLWTRPEPQ